MATWFVDGTNGSDANDGTTAATGGGHGPVATIGKAIAAGGLAGSGDTVYIAPGTYRQKVTLGVTPASELKVIGDVRRSQAWAASTPNGPVIWSGYTTNDFTDPGGSNLLTINGKSWFTFEDLWLIDVSARLVDATTTGTTHLTFRRCVLEGRQDGGNFLLDFAGTANVDPNILIEQCVLVGYVTSPLKFLNPTHTANYTTTITIRNNLFFLGASQAIYMTTSGGGAGFAGGTKIVHNTFLPIGFSNSFLVYADGSQQSPAITLEDNLIWQGTLTGGTGAYFASNYNRCIGTATIGVATAGKNDRIGATPAYINPLLFDFGQSWLWGLPPRPFVTPWPGSVLAGWGEGSVADTVDFANRPRLSGGGQATSVTPVTGTATAGGASTLTDGGASWTTDAYVGIVLTITGGTGSGQRRWVRSNTATVLTVDQAWVTNPDNTSTYSLDPHGALKPIGYIAPHEAYLPGGAANADGGSGNCLEILGPGDVKIRVAVPASATVISVKVKWDSNHADTNKPRAIMLGQPAIGIAATEDAAQNWHESVTATGTAGSGYETLTFSSITPTAAGWVEILLQSRSTQGNGIAYFDTVAA